MKLSKSIQARISCGGEAGAHLRVGGLADRHRTLSISDGCVRDPEPLGRLGALSLSKRLVEWAPSQPWSHAEATAPTKQRPPIFDPPPSTDRCAREAASKPELQSFEQKLTKETKGAASGPASGAQPTARSERPPARRETNDSSFPLLPSVKIPWFEKARRTMACFVIAARIGRIKWIGFLRAALSGKSSYHKNLPTPNPTNHGGESDGVSLLHVSWRPSKSSPEAPSLTGNRRTHTERPLSISS